MVVWEWQYSVQREGRARQVIGVLLQRLAKTTRIGATGGASKARTPEMNAQRLCKDAKPTERS